MKVLPAFIFLLATLLVLPSFVFALPNDIGAVCSGNNTIVYSIDSVRCVGNNCVVIQRNSTLTCQFGCNGKSVPNECNGSPFQINLLLFIAIPVLIIILAWIWRRIQS